MNLFIEKHMGSHRFAIQGHIVSGLAEALS